MNAIMPSIDGCDRSKSKLPASKRYGGSGHGGSVETSEAMFLKSAMFCDAGCNKWMRNLH